MTFKPRTDFLVAPGARESYGLNLTLHLSFPFRRLAIAYRLSLSNQPPLGCSTSEDLADPPSEVFFFCDPLMIQLPAPFPPN